MNYYQITGGRPLGGALVVQGAKNSVLPILAATLLAPGECVIHNCPNLSDVNTTLEILRFLGCRVHREGGTVIIDATAPQRWDIPDQLVREMRSSVVFLGALLTRMGGAQLCCPGGCQLGPRPIDIHISALRRLGAEIREESDGLRCRAEEMSGREIFLRLPSVGATENVMLCACGCQGTTTIVGAAREPEIVDLQNFLCAMGASISGAGSSVITIEGGHPFHPVEHTVMGDRIAAATYLCAAAATKGEVTLNGVDPNHLTAVLDVLREGGCHIEAEKKAVHCTMGRSLQGVAPIHTAPYPGFPTDAQPLLLAALSAGRGNTMLVEHMFDSRYRYIDELRRMGANIQVYGRVAVVNGGKLRGCRAEGSDLRGGAALVVAALAAQGESEVSGLQYIHRGYEDLARDMERLGGTIKTRIS